MKLPDGITVTRMPVSAPGTAQFKVTVDLEKYGEEEALSRKRHGVLTRSQLYRHSGLCGATDGIYGACNRARHDGPHREESIRGHLWAEWSGDDRDDTFVPCPHTPAELRALGIEL